MDKRSADYLGLSPQPTEWPRSLHGRLVDELVRKGVSLIVFDLAFVRPQTADEDMHFAGASGRAARVLRLENLERWRQPATAGNSVVPGEIWLDKLHRPLPVLAEAALGTAPFPLPRVPDRVSRFWTFLEGRGETEAFRAQRRNEACDLFDAIAQAHPDDGPSRFYVECCRAETDAAAIDRDGPIIRLNVK